MKKAAESGIDSPEPPETLSLKPYQTPQETKANRFIFLGIIVIFGIFLFYSLIQFFTAFLTAVVFYVLSKPFLRYLINRKGWKKSNAAIMVITISFFIILLPIVGFVSLVYNKISAVAENPESILAAVKHFSSVIEERFGVQLISNETSLSVQKYVTGLLALVLNQGLNFFANITMMYFMLYFFILHTNRIEAGIVFYLPFPRSKIMLFGNELVEQTFSNAVGVPAIVVVEGVFAYFAYLIAGLPEAGLWAVLTGIASIVPIIGTALLWAPIAAYFFITDHTWQGVFIALWGIIILGLLDNVTRFLLAKKMADVHPIVTVLGIIMGLNYFGLIGLVVGPLLISYFIILLRIYYTEYQQKPLRRAVKTPWPSYLPNWSSTSKNPFKKKNFNS